MHKLLKAKSSAFTVLVTMISTPSLSASAQADSWGGGWHNGWGWGHMFFGSIMMVLFWGGLILLVIFAVRSMGAGSGRGRDERELANRALEILEERFARGEIDKEEFEERRRLLSK